MTHPEVPRPTPYFFGYGSLVNRRTHDYSDAHRGAVHGWRRAWRHTPDRDVAFLTAVPCPHSQIEGLIAGVPGADWRALDEREFAYDRLPVTEAVRHAAGSALARAAETAGGLQDAAAAPALDIAIYAIPEGRHLPPETAHPILLSYLDVVLQGYLEEFGEDGARRFIETTDGWDAPLLDDRAAPRYPRHQRLSRDELAFVDELIAPLPLRRTVPA